MLFKETIELFRKYLMTVDRSKETIRGYMIGLACLLRFLEQRHNGPVYLDEITVEDVEAYLFHLKEQGACFSQSQSSSIYCQVLLQLLHEKRLSREESWVQIGSCTRAAERA